jgi:hypothetical protein
LVLSEACNKTDYIYTPQSPFSCAYRSDGDGARPGDAVCSEAGGLEGHSSKVDEVEEGRDAVKLGEGLVELLHVVGGLSNAARSAGARTGKEEREDGEEKDEQSGPSSPSPRCAPYDDDAS